MRIFIGLTEVSGYYSRLQQGMKEIGIEAEFFPLQDHRFGYKSTSSAWAPLFAQRCVKRRIDAQEKSLVQKKFWLLMVLLSRIILFVWAVSRFDVFIMGGGSSFFRFREFGLMRLLKRRIIYTFHGTDSRPAWMDGFCEGTSRMLGTASLDDYPNAEDLEVISRVNARRLDTVRRVERYANVIINAPPQAQLHKKPFVISHTIGIPVDKVIIEKKTITEQADRPVRILHSPSYHIGKGTVEIRNAISQLQQEGVAIDYKEISDRPHIEVRHAIEECDFVVDQVFSDTPMAGFAGEAALAGKPAVVFGYYSDYYKNDLAPGMRPPSLFCHPELLKETILRLAENTGERLKLGSAATEYVNTNWSTEAVAQRYLALAIGESIPDEWFYEPERNEYFMGMGVDESTLRKVISGYVERFGDSALGIDYSPGLKQSVLAFVASQKSCSLQR